MAESKIFYEVEQAARALGVSVEEVEEMLSTAELKVVQVGDQRRLVRIADVEALLERVRSGERLRTHRIFQGNTVRKAVAVAAAELVVAPDLLVHRVLESGNSWRAGKGGALARIVVKLPEDVEDTPATPEEGKTSPSPEADGKERVGETGVYYYAPEQAAVLLGADPHEVNLWIYLKKLPAVNINDYRWIPKRAVDERLAQTPGPQLQDPPKPFLITTPAEPEGAEPARLGTREVTPENQRLSPNLLEQKIEELEKEIRLLREELRIEKARNSPETRRDSMPPASSPAERRPTRRKGVGMDPAGNPA